MAYINPLNKKKLPYSEALTIKTAADALKQKVSPYQTATVQPVKPVTPVQPQIAPPQPKPQVPTAQTQTTAQVALPKGGPPISALPESGSGIVPPAEQQPTVPPQVQAQYDRIDQTIATLDQQLAALRQQQFRVGLNNPAAAGIASQIATLERQKAQLAQDRKGAMDQYNRIGQYESQLQGVLNQAPPELKTQIDALPETQKNEFYRSAIEQLGQNASPAALAQLYQQMFPAGYDFGLEKPGFTPDKGTLEEYQKQFGYDPSQSGATIGKTDTTGINTTGQTTTGAQVTQEELAALRQELSAQGYTEAEKDAILRGDLAALEADKQVAIRQAVAQASNSGFGQTLGAVINATAGTAQRYDTEAARLRGQLTQQGLEQAAQRRQAAIAGLGGVAEREAGIAGTQAQAGLGAAEIGSRENIAAGELQLAKDTLFQQGQLTALGMKIDENLKAYGMNLQKYQTDQGFDLALMENDLKQRIAQQTGDIAAAELQAKNITTAIQAGMEERRIDDQRASTMAELELKAAQGDVDSKFRVNQLKAEQELRKIGLDNDWSQFVGQVLYNIMSGREQLDQRRWELLQTIAAEDKRKGGGFGNILATLGGAFAGWAVSGGNPAGAAAGANAGSKVFG